MKVIAKKCASLHLHWDDTWSDEHLYLQDPAFLIAFCLYKLSKDSTIYIVELEE